MILVGQTITRRLLPIAVLVLLGSLAVGVAWAQHGHRATAAREHLIVRTFPVSWAYGYGSLGELKRAADVVVLAKAADTPSSSQEPNGLTFSDFSFTVERVLWDPHHQLTGNTLTVHQTGGRAGNQVFEIEDDPLIQAGEEDVLFLHAYAPGRYAVLGGPQGRFRVESGQVEAISSTHIPGFTGPVGLDQFLGEVADVRASATR